MLNRIQEELEQRSNDGSLRSLVNYDQLIDFASNDYLGFGKSELLGNEIDNILLENSNPNVGHKGSGGSRLLTGNSSFYLQAETEMASFFKSESALIFTSGYSANLGLLSAVLKRNDTVFFDEYSHASIKDGIRLGFAKSIKFGHNDLVDLENKLSKNSGTKFVVIESIYSMDGDLAPLTEISKLCSRFDAQLIVDEAHASGVFGDFGEGLVVQLGLENSVFARIHTFGKGLGTHGALISGSKELISYLINFSRPFIYTTALPPSNVAAILAGIRLSSKAETQRQTLWSNIGCFKGEAKKLGLNIMNSPSQIQGIIVPGNENIISLSNFLRTLKLDVRAIKSPTVPTGMERLRICLHSFNTQHEIEQLVNGIHKHING